MKVWLGLFVVGLAVAIYKWLREPIWAAAFAAYVYFAIPHLEFTAPELPYQAGFWALAALTSFRYGEIFRRDARRELDRAAINAVRAAIEAVRAMLSEQLTIAALKIGRPNEVRGAAIAAIEE